MPQYKIFNGPMPTTGLQVPVTTGTAVKTMLQVKSVTDVKYKVKAWGVSMNGAAAAAGCQWELVETGTVFGTVTASAAADIIKWDDSGSPVPTTYLTVGVSSTGYTATAEGSVAATRVFDSQLVQPTGQYVYEFSLGNEPMVAAGSALRVRCDAVVAIDALCWVIVEV